MNNPVNNPVKKPVWSLDSWAVIAAFAAALLIKLGVIASVPW
jgi:hypothetical protein